MDGPPGAGANPLAAGESLKSLCFGEEEEGRSVWGQENC